MRVKSVKTYPGLVAFFFFVVSLALTSYTAKNREGLSAGKAVVAESVRPFAVVTNGAYDWVTSYLDRYIRLIDVAEENESLVARLNKLDSVNARLTEIDKENSRLKKLLQSRSELETPSIAARVIGYDPSGWVQSITINRGSQDGIIMGLPVINGAGVVGQTVSVSPNSAKVLLIIDRASSVDAIVQESRARGVLDGTGNIPCDFRFVSESDEVQVGDKVVTSGMDDIYPKGLVLGVITQAGRSTGGLFKLIKVSPAVNFPRLEDVLVMFTNENKK